MFPKWAVKMAPTAKFWVALVTVIAMSLSVPLGSPFWLTVAIGVLNAVGVFFTPNASGEYEYREPESEHGKAEEAK